MRKQSAALDRGRCLEALHLHCSNNNIKKEKKEEEEEQQQRQRRQQQENSKVAWFISLPPQLARN